MAETHLKFGPQWLRALSDGSNVASPPASPGITKYKLAEYRYGREEMLGLFDQNLKMPEELHEFPNICKEKLQFPLAFITMTEEEQRLWSRSVNSDTMLRLAGKAGGIGVGGGSSNSSIRGLRGGAADRGKGRGRGIHFPRGISLEDGEEGPPGSFSRSRPFERSQSLGEKDPLHDERDKRYDRSYPGRNLEENGHSSWKESSRASTDNWRSRDQHKNSVDEGGWRTGNSRTSQWGNSSWRSHSERDHGRDDRDRGPLHDSDHNFTRNGLYRPLRSGRKNSYCDDDDGDGKYNLSHDQLPEWSREDRSKAERVGSFDASGAFMETKGDESSSDDSGSKSKSQEKNKTRRNDAQNPERTDLDKESEGSDSRDVSDNDELYLSSPEKEDPPNLFQSEPPHVVPPVEAVNRTDESHKQLFHESDDVKESHQVQQPTPATVVTSLETISDTVKTENCAKESKPISVNNSEATKSPEEDGFFHLVKAAENMMAQWTAEEEQEVPAQAQSVDKNTVLPLHHEDAYKWFYRDPQSVIQGPFSSHEMFEWFTAGYFTLNLLVRRGCDERFAQLGELFRIWGRVPFVPGPNPPPLRSVPLSVPQTTAIPQKVSSPTPSRDQDQHLRLFQQQILQQQLLQQHQQQLFLRQQLQMQAQIQQLLSQLKQQEGFSSLSTQQQQEMLTQQLLAQQPPRPTGLAKPPNLLDPINPLQLPLLGFSLSPLLKNDGSLPWPISASPGNPNVPASWMMGGMNLAQTPPTGSIWDVDPAASGTIDLQQQQEREREQQEKQREEERQKLEEEKRLQEELKRQEEERRREEELKRQKEEEERKRAEEAIRQEEERRHREEEEKRRLEELRRQEEQRRLELEKQEEERRLEMQRQEEQRRLQQMEEERRRQEEEERRRKELEKRKELERKRELEIQQERERQQELERQELEKQREIEMKKEAERHMEIQRQNEALRKLQEQQQKAKAQMPAWRSQVPAVNQNASQSLAEIQKLQEEKERQEQERQRQAQFQQQLMTLQQAQQRQSHLSWAQRPVTGTNTVKSLMEIQQEEAEQLAKQRHAQAAKPPLVSINTAGVWSNASNSLSWGGQSQPSSTPWRISENPSGGFWDDAVDSIPSQKSRNTKSESAFPALGLSTPANSTNSNKNKSTRRKDEEVVMKLFETHTKQQEMDEFTKWCTESLSHFPPTVDVPTFVTFLKDIESPYEVHDYVRSYLGDNKESREFAKHFMEKRSKFCNDMQKPKAEENSWKPVAAATPVAIPTAHRVKAQQQQPQHPCNINMEIHAANNGNKGKKKKKNKMLKVDNSMLGFTVQADPDRINVGEIVRGEGM